MGKNTFDDYISVDEYLSDTEEINDCNMLQELLDTRSCNAENSEVEDDEKEPHKVTNVQAMEQCDKLCAFLESFPDRSDVIVLFDGVKKYVRRKFVVGATTVQSDVIRFVKPQ